MKNKNDNLYIIISIHLIIIYKYLFDSIVYEFGTKQIDTLKPLRSIDGLNILLNLNIPLPETYKESKILIFQLLFFLKKKKKKKKIF